MQVTIIFSLVFSVLIAFFAVQNAGVVVINFLWYKVSMSQAVVILCSALVGVLIMLPFDVIRTIKYKFKLMELSGENKRLKEELKKTTVEKEAAEKEAAEKEAAEKAAVKSEKLQAAEQVNTVENQ